MKWESEEFHARGMAELTRIIFGNERGNLRYTALGPFSRSPGNLSGPISIFLNVFFADYTVIYRHGSWPIFLLNYKIYKFSTQT